METKPTPWAFVMWNAKGERGRRASGSGGRTWRHREKRGARNPSGGEKACKGGVKNCCCGLRVPLMEKYKELAWF